MIGSASGVRRLASGDTARLWASARWPLGWGRRRGGRSALGVGAVAARRWGRADGRDFPAWNELHGGESGD
ncbi:hypothetical protein GUJ93_ZPchr0002g26780 [Zizania palustris]|uniref:Uncharacterized protein n=1 Tax=Zizania palustris TaxID=103762 RepID=A0A8J5RYM1_ZIZPA|nr:hypothetical protein GUJ93_ZPchr0002g26780 [Zizania palustris]